MNDIIVLFFGMILGIFIYAGIDWWMQRRKDRENFNFEIIEFCNSEYQMYKIEKIYVNEDWISRKDTYNIMFGGKGGFGHIDNFGENNPFYGKRHTEETKRKIGEANSINFSGKNNPMYGVRLTGHTNGMYGKNHSDDSKMKMSKTKIEKIASGDITYDHLSGVAKSEKTKRKMSEAAKKRFSNPVERKKMSDAAKCRPLVSKETRKKMSESQKRRWNK